MIYAHVVLISIVTNIQYCFICLGCKIQNSTAPVIKPNAKPPNKIIATGIIPQPILQANIQYLALL